VLTARSSHAPRARRTDRYPPSVCAAARSQDSVQASGARRNGQRVDLRVGQYPTDLERPNEQPQRRHAYDQALTVGAQVQSGSAGSVSRNEAARGGKRTSAAYCRCSAWGSEKMVEGAALHPVVSRGAFFFFFFQRRRNDLISIPRFQTE